MLRAYTALFTVVSVLSERDQAESVPSGRRRWWFVVAVDLFNDSTVRDDTDSIIETYDRAVDLLKNAALARPRR